MAALTKTQLEHAKAKVQTLVAGKLAAIRTVLGPQPEVIELSDEQKHTMVLDGSAKLDLTKDFSKTPYYENLYYWYIFPTTGEMVNQQFAHDTWQKAYDIEAAKVRATEEQVIDELVMSPDGMSALNKIAAAFA
jgi:hypothetical protein